MSLCLEIENLETAITCLNSLRTEPSNSITIASHDREVHAYNPIINRLILH
jgi:DNA repair exonuclease SbcCD ATPase subunit